MPNEYGYYIHDSVSSTVQVHALSFRADLDNYYVSTTQDILCCKYDL